MASEQNVPLTIPSGVVKTRSGEGAKGRWADTRNMRFVDGKPQKRAGYEKLNTTVFDGRARGMMAWNTVKGKPLYALGTNLRLYGSTDGEDIFNITPLRFNNTFEDAFSTTDGSGIISLEYTAHGLSAGDLIRFYGNSWNGGSKIGGVTLAQEYEVESVTDTDNVELIRNDDKADLTDPFTTDGTTTCTVTDAAHGAATGDMAYFSGSSAVGGQTPDGEYEITVVDDDSYTITLGGTASAATGGGAVTRYFIDKATSTVASGGGKVNYILRETDPFSVSDGSTVLVVTHTAHGALYNDMVVISGADAVGGQDVNGERRIIEVIDADSYKLRMDGAASSTGTGGGSVLLEYEISTGSIDRILAERGYGEGSYGVGAYGSADLLLDPVYYEPRFWSLSKEGGNMVAGVIAGGVYYWDSTAAGRAEVIPDAPDDIRYAFQTEERHLHVLGVDGDPLLMAWASVNSVNEWTPTSTNTANSGRRVNKGSALIAGTPVSNGVNLIWTDTACYIHQFTGSQFVYDTRLESENAGLIGPGAFAIAPDGVFWMSQSRFLMWNGTVIDVPRSEEISDWVFAQILDSQKTKCWAHYDAVNNSIDFYFVPNGRRELLPNGEPVSYVTLNLDDYSWCLGEEARTTGATFNTGAQNPYRCGLDGYVYKHETGLDHDGVAAESWIKLAPLDLSSGGVSMEVFGFDPDMKRQVGDVEITIETYDRNPATVVETEVETFSEDTEMVDFRIAGRRASLLLKQTVLAGDFALDTPQLLVQRTGKKR
jgi:hypothetical protein